jgi:16S rRNA G966 N2-methylase RsmD
MHECISMPMTNSNVAKRDFLFRFVPQTTRTRLKLDEESLYSTTDQMTAEKITKDILRFVPRTSSITDATACIGGTALAFSKEFAYVNAIELNDVRFKYLVHNLHELHAVNVNCIRGDSLEECTKLDQQVIFIDPPWGGPEYKNKTRVSLSMCNVSLSSICHTLYNHTAYIVIKVPTNFDEESFVQDTSAYMTLVYKNTGLRKMHLLIFKTL